MRLCIAFVILLFATPVYAQATMGTSSGASASVNVSDAPACDSTTHLITTPTIAALRRRHRFRV
jgi:hypothetical protein